MLNIICFVKLNTVHLTETYLYIIVEMVKCVNTFLIEVFIFFWFISHGEIRIAIRKMQILLLGNIRKGTLG